MQASDSPSRIPVPFANSGAKNTIPTEPSPTPELASLESGFPPITMTPIAAGGVPPSGMDFNGILNLISAAARWAQAGGSYSYDASFSAAVGGYPLGAVLLNASGNGFWRSTANNNTTNPDSGGANWVAIITNLATPTVAGIIQIATAAQAAAGIDTQTAMTPALVRSATPGRLLGVSVYTSNGTYTPNPAMRFCVVEVQGAGGGGGGGTNTTAGQWAAGAGGGAGGYRQVLAQAASIGSSMAVTAGTPGSGGSAGSLSGTAGGASSLGTLVSATGGGGGTGASAIFSSTYRGPGPGGSTGSSSNSAGQLLTQSDGQAGTVGFGFTGGAGVSGSGGSSVLGLGGSALTEGSGGMPAKGYGAGGGGGCSGPGSSGTDIQRNGGAGSGGLVRIWEYA